MAAEAARRTRPDQRAGVARPNGPAHRSAGEPRRRSAADTRERLLGAAESTFAERGYERATLREIGQRAEVDPALIARYFGSKAALYLAALARTRPASPDDPLDLTDPGVIERFLGRVAAGVPTPILQSAVEPHPDPVLRDATAAHLDSRVTVPAEQLARQASATDARLRAEIAAAALSGIALSRSHGALPELAGADGAVVAAILADMLRAALRP